MIADLKFNELRSPRLAEYFKTYLACRNDLRVPDTLSAETDAVLQSSVDWLACRRAKRSSKREYEIMTPRATNPDTFDLLTLQNWVWQTPARDMIATVEHAARIASPCLAKLLRQTSWLTEDIEIFVRPGSDELVAKLFVLEVLKGILDPALQNSEIANSYGAKLLEVAEILGVSKTSLVARELADSQIRELFAPVYAEKSS